METLNLLRQTPVIKQSNTNPGNIHYKIKNNLQPGSIERSIIRMMVKLRLLYFAIIIFKRPGKVSKAFKTLITIRKTVSGGDLNKMYKIGGKYYVSQYRPGWPSKMHDNFLKNEFDFILIEGAALNNFSDSREIVTYVDEVFTVFSAASTVSHADDKSIKFITSLNEKNKGFILNNVLKENINF